MGSFSAAGPRCIAVALALVDAADGLLKGPRRVAAHSELKPRGNCYTNTLNARVRVAGSPGRPASLSQAESGSSSGPFRSAPSALFPETRAHTHTHAHLLTHIRSARLLVEFADGRFDLVAPYSLYFAEWDHHHATMKGRQISLSVCVCLRVRCVCVLLGTSRTAGCAACPP